MSEMMQAYRQLAELTGAMRAAAARGDWDDLVALEQRSSAQVAALQPHDGVPASAAERQLKADLIRQMLADDRAIRELTQPRLAQLERLLHNVNSERRLHQAYLG